MQLRPTPTPFPYTTLFRSTAQNLWKLPTGATEATPLTADFPGTSKTPMWWQSRIYFVSDRDGSMNLWSMDPDGHDLDRKSTRLNSSHPSISYAVFCLKKKN